MSYLLCNLIQITCITEYMIQIHKNKPRGLYIGFPILFLVCCYFSAIFFSFFFAPSPPSPSPVSRYFETFPPSAPATNHLSLDILQSRFPKEGSGLPSSSLSAQPLGPPSATRRVSLGQVRAVAVVGQTACTAHFSPPRAAEGSGPWPELWMWQALETTCNSLDACFQGLRAQR